MKARDLSDRDFLFGSLEQTLPKQMLSGNLMKMDDDAAQDFEKI